MKTKKQFFDEMHRLGRISAVVAIIIMLAIPTIVGLYFDAMPDFKMVLIASAGLLAVFVPLNLSETISYSPIMGTSIYVTLITGNVLNLKLPAIINAFRIMEVEQGTEEADIVANVAIAISSVITIIILALSVMAMSQLKPILESGPMQTAAPYILPALFGSLSIGILGKDLGGGIVAKGRLKAAILPTLLVAVVYFISPFIAKNLSGALILITIPMIYFTSKYLYKKGSIVVILPTGNLDAEKEDKR